MAGVVGLAASAGREEGHHAQMEHPTLERNIGRTGKVDGNIEIQMENGRESRRILSRHPANIIERILSIHEDENQIYSYTPPNGKRWGC